MAKNFMPEPEAPAKLVWLVNPVGSAYEVPEYAPEVQYARDGNHGWKFAAPEQIEAAKADMAKRIERETTRQNAVAAASGQAQAMIEAAKQIKRGPDRPRKVEPETE